MGIAVAVVLALVAAWFFFLRDGGADEAAPAPTQSATAAPAPPESEPAEVTPAPTASVAPPPVEPTAAPSEEPVPTAAPSEPAEQPDLDSLIPEQVGDFTLDTVGTNNDSSDLGAIDARFPEYISSGGGDVVLLGMREFPDERTARRWLEVRVEEQTEGGIWEVAKSQRLEDADGNLQGRYVLTQQTDAPTVQNLRWTNGRFGFGLGLRRGSGVDLEAFYDDLPF